MRTCFPRAGTCLKAAAALLLVFSHCAFGASAAPTGYWLVHVGGEARERILKIDPADAAAATPISVKYGYADTLPAPASNVSFAEAGDAYLLRFNSGAGSLIEAKYPKNGAEQFTGTFLTKNGTEKEISFSRISKPTPLKPEEIVGNWLVHVEGEPRDRILQINSGRPESGKTRLDARYGYADAKLASLNEATLSEDDDLPQLHLVSPANSIVEARYIANADGFFLGRILYTSGKEKAIRLTKIDLDSYRLAAGNALLAQLRVNKNSVIQVINISAPDCPFCEEWKYQNLKAGHNGFRDSTEWNSVQMVRIDKSSYTTRGVSVYLFPDALKDIGKQLNTDKRYKIVCLVTPAFVVLVDGKIAKWGVGKQWETDVFPFIQQVVALKQKQPDGTN